MTQKNAAPITGIRTDLFEAIKYEQHVGRKGRPIFGLQLDAHFVFKDLVLEAWTHFAANIPVANPYKFHSSEDLFADPVRWKNLVKGDHIAIGRCLAYFVRHEMLPLECVNPHHTNRLYHVTAR